MLGSYPLAGAPLAADPDAAGGVGFSTNILALIALDALSDGEFDLTGLHAPDVNLVGSNAETTTGFKMIQNFEMVSGDTKSLIVRVKDADGDVVDITGATVKWRAARSYGKTASITKATGGSGVTLTDPTNGVFVVALADTDTEDLAGIFYHEAEVTFSDDTVSTVLRGTMKINRDLIEAT